MGVQVGIVIGGGNIFRGLSGAQKGFDRVTGDYMGMLGTVMNALALFDAFRRLDCPVLLQSGLDVASPFINKLDADAALAALDDDNIVVFGGGTGRPGCSTDTASAGRAYDIKADMIVKLTNVDGVYDKDPDEYPDAVMYDEVTFDEVLEKQLGIMDLNAMEMCMNNNIPIVVANISNETVLEDIFNGKKVGTIVHN